MTPVDQEFIHDPEGGVFGDCQRACIATLLDLPLGEVPHFLFDGTKDAVEFGRRLNEFLVPRGLMHLETEMFSFRDSNFPGCYHLIYGKSVRGFSHAVVGFNGVMVHDPHPTKAGLLEETQEAQRYAFLVRTGVA